MHTVVTILHELTVHGLRGLHFDKRSGGTIVLGGGAKCGTAWRYCGERAEQADGEEEDEEEKERRKPAKEKKKRMAKKDFVGSRSSRMA